MCPQPPFPQEAFAAGSAASQGLLSYSGSKGFHNNRAGEKNVKYQKIYLQQR